MRRQRPYTEYEVQEDAGRRIDKPRDYSKQSTVSKQLLTTMDNTAVVQGTITTEYTAVVVVQGTTTTEYTAIVG